MKLRIIEQIEDDLTVRLGILNSYRIIAGTPEDIIVELKDPSRRKDLLNLAINELGLVQAGLRDINFLLEPKIKPRLIKPQLIRTQLIRMYSKRAEDEAAVAEKIDELFTRLAAIKGFIERNRIIALLQNEISALQNNNVELLESLYNNEASLVTGLQTLAAGLGSDVAEEAVIEAAKVGVVKKRGLIATSLLVVILAIASIGCANISTTHSHPQGPKRPAAYRTTTPPPSPEEPPQFITAAKKIGVINPALIRNIHGYFMHAGDYQTLLTAAAVKAGKMKIERDSGRIVFVSRFAASEVDKELDEILRALGGEDKTITHDKVRAFLRQFYSSLE